jgi:SOS-response transcriptional repressor LexA
MKTPAPPIPVHTREPAPSTCVDAEPFALRVTDDSMAPEFPCGCVVIVDPTLAPAAGRFVVAQTSHGTVLRRLAGAAGQWTLQALAPGHPPEPVVAAAVLGGVTQRAGRRRREHKRYA